MPQYDRRGGMTVPENNSGEGQSGIRPNFLQVLEISG